MRYVKRLPADLEQVGRRDYGGGCSVYHSKRSKRFYECYEDCIVSYSNREYGSKYA